MPPVTGEIKVERSPYSDSMTTSTNAGYCQQNIDRNLLRKPDGFVYIFSISRRSFISLHPLVRVGVKACKEGERWNLVAKLPDPFQQADIEPFNGYVRAVAFDARKVAQDYCWPDNTSLDQDLDIAGESIGNNLTKQGVFWVVAAECTFDESGNPIPPESAIVRAEKRVERYYRNLMEEARALEISNPKELEAKLNIDHRLAADYFGETPSWHKRQTKAVTCRSCGETKPDQLMHKNSMGFLCIDPSVEGWKMAVNTGMKKKEEVPEDFQWWNTLPEKSGAKTTAAWGLTPLEQKQKEMRERNEK